MPEPDYDDLLPNAYEHVRAQVELDYRLWLERADDTSEPFPFSLLRGDLAAGRPVVRPADWVPAECRPAGCGRRAPVRVWPDGAVELVDDPDDEALVEYMDL